MAPAWQEIIWRAAQRSLVVMCPACWCNSGLVRGVVRRALLKIAASCVDGPRLARDHLACSAEVACSHVSGLLVQSGWTAGPDGVREPSPHHSNGIDVPMKRQVWLGCVGIDRLCHHASLLSRKFQNVAPPPKPPPPRAGSSHAGASPPRRYARSCWLALPPPPGSAAAGAVRSPTDRHWSPSSVANWRWRR